jgi:hypothetical protein
MYKHHEESLKNMVSYFENREEIIALNLVTLMKTLPVILL